MPRAGQKGLLSHIHFIIYDVSHYCYFIKTLVRIFSEVRARPGFPLSFALSKALRFWKL